MRLSKKSNKRQFRKTARQTPSRNIKRLGGHRL